MDALLEETGAEFHHIEISVLQARIWKRHKVGHVPRVIRNEPGELPHALFLAITGNSCAKLRRTDRRGRGCVTKLPELREFPARQTGHGSRIPKSHGASGNA